MRSCLRLLSVRRGEALWHLPDEATGNLEDPPRQVPGTRFGFILDLQGCHFGVTAFNRLRRNPVTEAECSA